MNKNKIEALSNALKAIMDILDNFPDDSWSAEDEQMYEICQKALEVL